MTVRLYRSTDTSAPTLSGTAGDLITVLDACLVNGYGSKSAAGWTKPSLGATNPGTNVSVYKQGTGSNGYHLRVNDSAARVGTTDEAAGAPTARDARFRGYETMNTLTDPAAGSNPFPSVAANTIGYWARKSASADTVQRPWVVLADQRTMYMFVLTGDVANSYLAWGFGEFYSFKGTSDTGRIFICGRNTENSASAASTIEGMGFQVTAAANTNGATAMVSSRDYQGTVTNTNIGIGGDLLTSTTSSFIGTLGFTNGSDNRTYISNLRVCQASPTTYRGRMRGLWLFGHPVASVSDGDTFSGTGDLNGKSFLILKLCSNSLGVYVLETSDTWDTN